MPLPGSTNFSDAPRSVGVLASLEKTLYFKMTIWMNMMMKYLTTTLFIACLLLATAIGGAFLEYFNGRSDGDNVVLEWKTRSESNLLRYEVQRKAGHSGEFITLATVQPKGSNSMYSYIDRAAYKNAASLYIYRLKIVDQGSSPVSYSNEISITHSVNSVKRTWGSIKAMFR